MRNRALIILAALFMAAPSPVRASPEAPPEMPVTLRTIGTPLRTVAKELSGSRVELTVAEELREVKATLICHERPLSEVMERLAQVFGAEWQYQPGSQPTRFLLRRQAVVAQWIRTWKRARVAAETAARKAQEEAVRRELDRCLSLLGHPFPTDSQGREQLPTGVTNATLARLVRTLGPRALQTLAGYIAAINPLQPSVDVRPLPAPLRFRFRDLTSEQQGLLRQWVRGPGNEPLSPRYTRRMEELPDSVIEFGSLNGVTVAVRVIGPGQDSYEGPAVGGSLSWERLRPILYDELFRQLAQAKTPPDALLGARARTDGSFSPEVRLDAPPPELARTAPLPRGALAREFLPALADATGLTLVADYHTRSDRLPDAVTATRAVPELLQGVADTYSLVFRQQGQYLLARSRYWPDWDEGEIPAPLPEKWITAKEDGRGLTIDDFVRMMGVPDPQLNGLASYSDRPRGIRFAELVGWVRRHRWALTLYQSLPEARRRQLLSQDGLPVRSLNLKNRTLLAQASGVNIPWDRAYFCFQVKESELRKGDRLITFLLWIPGPKPEALWLAE